MIVYGSQTVSSFSMVNGAAQISTSQAVFSWTDRGGPPDILLTSDGIAAEALPIGVQRLLFDGDTLVSPQVGQVAITNIFPVRAAPLLVSGGSGVVEDDAGMVVLFMSFSAQIQGVLASTSKRIQAGYTIYAIVTWCDPARTLASECLSRNVYTAPCPLGCTAKPALTCGGVCNGGLDKALELGRVGSLTFIPFSSSGGVGGSFPYLFLPQSGTMDSYDARIVWIHPKNGLLLAPPSPLSAGQQQWQGSLSTASQTKLLLGGWTRAQVFSFTPESSLMGKSVRDAWAHPSSASGSSSSGLLLSIPSLNLFQSDQRQQQSTALNGMGTLGLTGQWLAEVRFMHGAGGWELRSFLSQRTVSRASLNLNCTYLSCAGCSTSRLRLLCNQAQDCVLSKCVGTIIPTRNILCSVGSVVESSAKHAIVTWRAMHMGLSEVCLLAMRDILQASILGAGSSSGTVLQFPTEGFYTMLCTCKDSFAAMIGLGLSVGHMLAPDFTSLNGASLDLSGAGDVGALAGEGVLKSASLAGLVYSVITSSTLLPTMALHRWLLCIANASSAAAGGVGSLQVEFGDATLDDSWSACGNLDGLGGLLLSNDLAGSGGDMVTEFVKFTTSLASGLGETVLYGMQLSFTAAIDYFIGVVWSVQDVLSAYNLRACKLPNYAMRYVLRCACGDLPFRIPHPQRGHGWQDGAFWCVGTLSMVLSDGSTAIVYNPYTLDQLSAGVAGVTTYIECISSSFSASDCSPPPGESTGGGQLSILMDQGVEPIAVWARCKSNYALKAWDTGAGMLFSASSAAVPDDVASRVGSAFPPDFVGCMQDATRQRTGDYSDCATLFFNLRYDGRSSSSAYYLYEASGGNKDEPPDACQVFTGLQASANAGSPLGNLMDACVLEENAGQAVVCDLNPLVWSGAQPQKHSVASVHGLVPPSTPQTEADARALYEAPLARLRAAYAEFNASFAQEAPLIDVALFSADGDLIHTFVDCMFLGPYSRVDYRAVDEAGVLSPIHWSRDEGREGGLSRNFTPCYGDGVMYGDHRLPFTCGSPVRRSIIKYFLRDYIQQQQQSATTGGALGLKSNITRLIRSTVDAVYANYTSMGSWGCMDPATGRCSLDACQLKGNGFAPCLTSSYEVSKESMSGYVVDTLLGLLEPYYAHVQGSTLPWSAYHNVSAPAPAAPAPAQWGRDPAMASAAADLSHFSAAAPAITAYSAQEAYSMPSPDEARAQPDLDLLESPWGVCMALLGQQASTLPLLGAAPGGFVDDGGVDLARRADRIAAARNMTQAAMRSGSPFVWHRGRRHAPSHSAVCASPSKRSSKPTPHAQARLRIKGSSLLTTAGGFVIRQDEGRSLPLFGFLSRTLGEAGSGAMCVCALDHPTVSGMCQVTPDTCASLPPGACPGTLGAACSSNQAGGSGGGGGAYLLQDAAGVLGCLVNLSTTTTPGGGGVRCPELGPSDLWGLYPVTCGNDFCDGARGWVGAGTNDAVINGIRFLNDGRSGVRLPNYRHVNDTYHTAINYAAMMMGPLSPDITSSTAASDLFMAQPACYGVEDLAPPPPPDGSSTLQEALDLAGEGLEELLPAAQLVSDSPVVAVCARYAVEEARASFLETNGAPNARNARLQSDAWARRCAAKATDLAACQMAGMYYDGVPPPSGWAALAEARCGLRLLLPTASGGRYYIAPQGCVLVDRVARRMYDARLCAMGGAGVLLVTQITEACALSPQPLDMLLLGEDAVPYSLLHSAGGHRLTPPLQVDEAGLNPALMTLRAVDAIMSFAASNPERDHVSHVWDWMDPRLMPPGVHTTAPTDPSELAPVVFDSHYAFDPDAFALAYVHSSLRNASLLHAAVGAGGVCRATNVRMPMFDANTNRVCTRMARAAANDTPHMPVAAPKRGGGPEEGRPPFSAAYMDRYFLPERCAASHDDVPWSSSSSTGDDPQSNSVGGLPGWQRSVSVDSQGNTLYLHDTYPSSANGGNLVDLYTPPDDGWGGCASAVRWGAGIACNPSAAPAASGCPMPAAVCLPLLLASSSSSLNETTAGGEGGGGMCVSNGNHGGRPTCMLTAHCDDGLVCLADGGCAPLRMHVWNRIEHEWDMEFTVIADECGFLEKGHPYTQSTRGASPWETVPDLLSMHGFCSHRDWFSYRNALWSRACPLSTNAIDPSRIGGAPAGSFLSCNTTGARWPWVHERFDRGDATQKPFQTMAQGRSLLTVPHPCDMAYAHLQNPFAGRRMSVCSGFQGHEEFAPDTYALVAQQDKKNATPGIARWMRTYEEATGDVHVGALGDSVTADVPLGFLGADLASQDSRTLFDMASFSAGGADFFRCADRMACSNPGYTYGGYNVKARMVPPPSSSNNNSGTTMTMVPLTESSMRLCGAIGYAAAEWAEGGVCWLDIALFPLFSILLRTPAGSVGCVSLWPSSVLSSSSSTTTAATVGVVRVPVLSPSAVSSAAIRGSPTTLFCEEVSSSSVTAAVGGGGRCAYASRSSTVLTNEAVTDSVMALSSGLNGLIASAGEMVLAFVKRDARTRAYEHINLCTAQLMRVIETSQALQQQPAYGTWGPSGLYIALRVELYELPVAWLQHAMHVTLLSTIDPNVAAPALGGLAQGGITGIDLFLWGETERAPLCGGVDLQAKPTLWGILCEQAHPAHTFVLDGDDPFQPGMQLLADGLAAAIRDQAAEDVRSHLPSVSGSLGARCYTAASWVAECADDACLAAKARACNRTVLPTADGRMVCEEFAVDPCDPSLQNGNPFTLGGLVEDVPLVSLNALGGGPSGGLLAYLETLTQEGLLAAQKVAVPVDYIGNTDLVTWSRMGAPIVQVWPLADFLPSSSSSSSFDVNDWLRKGVCEDTLPWGSTCVDQYAAADRPQGSSACLYHPWNTPQAETERYLMPPGDQEEEPSLVLYYGDGTTEVLPVCELPGLMDDGFSCVAQYQGGMTRFAGRTLPKGVVPCDIVGLDAPPGVQIRGFAVRMGASAWLARNGSSDGLCDDGDAQIAACTWRVDGPGLSPYSSGWWYAGNSGSAPRGPHPELDAFRPLQLDNGYFASMKGWWKDVAATQWAGSGGCGGDGGLCSIAVRLEPASGGAGAAFCGMRGQHGTTASSYATYAQPPMCDAVMGSAHDGDFTPYVIARGTNATLYRCGPCTRIADTVMASSSSSSYYLNCSLPGTLADLAGPQVTPYLHDMGALSTMLAALSAGGEGFLLDPSVNNANGTAIYVRMPPSSTNPAIDGSLVRWGRLADVAGVSSSSSSSAVCDPRLSPSSCGFAGVNMDWAVADDLAIWNNAVANPQQQFTMVCGAEPYTPQDAEVCNPRADDRRQRLAAFVDRQYRGTNGVWMHSGAPGTGHSHVQTLT